MKVYDRVMKLSCLLFAVAGCVVAAAGDSPFACDMKALTPVVRKHHFEVVTPAVRKLVKGSKELPDGFAFELPADSAAIQLAAEWASNERLCCPFLEITMRIERERGRFWLQLTGRERTKEFIHVEFARWL